MTESLRDSKWYIIKKIYLFTRERERERESESMNEWEEAEGENPQADFLLSAEPKQGLDLMTQEITTWVETKSSTLNRQSHPGASAEWHFLEMVCRVSYFESKLPRIMILILKNNLEQYFHFTKKKTLVCTGRLGTSLTASGCLVEKQV